MNESYRLGEQSIIAYLQRLANGVSTAELDVAALGGNDLGKLLTNIENGLFATRLEHSVKQNGSICGNFFFDDKTIISWH